MQFANELNLNICSKVGNCIEKHYSRTITYLNLNTIQLDVSIIVEHQLNGQKYDTAIKLSLLDRLN